MREKKVSIRDIARQVGVSTALVSYVLNGLEKEKRVGRELAEKIRGVALELNYQPNQIARSLRKGSTNTIGLIVADISNPFFSHLARVIEDEAARYGYTVVFGSSDESCHKSAQLVDTLQNRQVDGFIMSPSEGCEDQVKAMLGKNFPLVLLDRYFPELATNHVILNNYEATCMAVECFLRHGYRRIRMVAYKSGLVHMQERIRGYRDTMQAHQLVGEIEVKEMLYVHMAAEMDKYLEEVHRNRSADAMLFATNALTLSGLYALTRLQVTVPQEMAVIGFDGHEAFDFFQPPLSFIQQPLAEMGREGVRILVEQIRGSAKTVQVVLKPQLIERKSSGSDGFQYTYKNRDAAIE